MTDAPEKIWLSAADSDNERAIWTDPDEGGTEYTRSDLVAELAAENERLTEALASTGAVKVSREDIAKMVYEGMSWAAMCGPTPNGTVPVWEDRGNSLGQDEARRIADRILSALEPTPPELNVRELIADIEAGKADGFLNDGSDPHGNDLNCPHCGGSGHIDDVHPTPPEGQQEPVAWASVKDHLPEVGSKFVLLYDDGSGASLYFRHDSGYIDADGDECDALDENRMWAYLPAGFDLWCEGACEPITLPKWKGPSNPRPSEQAVTEALVERMCRTPFIEGFTPTTDEWQRCETVQDQYDLMKRRIREGMAALKAAMEAGRNE